MLSLVPVALVALASTAPLLPHVADDDAVPPQRGADDAPPLTDDFNPFVIPEDDGEPPVIPKYGQPLPFYQIAIHEGFWRDVLDRNRDISLPAIWNQVERSGRFVNFESVGSRRPRPHRGRVYDDSDVYKLLEGAAWTYAESQDARLLDQIENGSQRVVRALGRDGYINTWHSLNAPDERFTDMPHGHELYCIGHLIEAAAARYEVDGGRTLLDAALRAVRLVMREFGPEARPDVCGHPEIELALIRLHEITGEEAHLELAEWFINQRGRTEGRATAGEYAQDHLPLREQTEVVGHAVRAMYLYAAAADLARIRDDEELTATLVRLWDDLVARKMYVTGGVGSSAANEGFTHAFDLPNDGAYAETCAAVGLSMWAHRMNLLTFDARYVDVMERAQMNALLAGVSMHGDTFFYANPLASHGGSRRSAWFQCACCPPNLMRHLASMRNRLFVRTRGTRAGNTLYVNHYLSGEVATSFGRNTVLLLQRTDYPWSGRVQIWLSGGMTRPYRIALRIPEWAESFTIKVDGEIVEPVMEKGYAVIARPWTTNQKIDLDIPMPVRIVEAPAEVLGNQGRFALARGPLVYCVEGVDSAPDLRRLSFDPSQEFTIEGRDSGTEDDPLRGMTTIRGTATRTLADGSAAPVPFEAVPYFAWANRDPGPMLVWLPTRRDLADPEPLPGLSPSASIVSDRDPLIALHDGLAPDPDDVASWSAPRPRFTWWPQLGSWEWVAYDFAASRRVGAVELFWFDDLRTGGQCTSPRAVRLQRREGDEWVTIVEAPVVPDGPADEPGRLTRLEFDPIETTGLRLEVRLQEGHSGGLLEWRVIDAEN